MYIYIDVLLLFIPLYFLYICTLTIVPVAYIVKNQKTDAFTLKKKMEPFIYTIELAKHVRSETISEDIIKYLLKLGANINYVHKNLPIFYIACSNEKVTYGILSLLLKNGADPNKPAFISQRYVSSACAIYSNRAISDSIVKLLVTYNTNMSTRKNFTLDVFMLFLNPSNNISILKVLQSILVFKEEERIKFNLLTANYL